MCPSEKIWIQKTLLVNQEQFLCKRAFILTLQV